MKYLLFFLLLIISVPAHSSDFRNTSWGMSKEQVKKTEKAEILNETENKVSYLETVVKYPALVVYKFDNNKLIWGSYAFKQVNDTDDEYLQDFLNFHTVLSNKYGKSKNLDRWTNKESEHKETPVSAVREGDLVMWRSWETPSTIIKLIMYGYGGNFNTDTYYFSKEYKDKPSGVFADIMNDKF